MDKLKDWFNRCVLDSPGCKTFFGIILPIFTGVLSGLLIAELSTSTEINWKLLTKAKSFYGLVALIYIIYKYNRAIYDREKEVERFLDSDYCIAYMRSQCLPEAAEQFKRQIRDGKGGELKQAMDELRKVLK